MALIKPAQPRHRKEVILNGLRYIIPAQRQWLGMLFMVAWLSVWAIAEIGILSFCFSCIRSIWTDGLPKGGALFGGAFIGLLITIWLAFWTYGGMVAIASIVWQLFGREILTVTPLILSIENRALCLKRSYEYPISEVKDIRVNRWPVSSDDDKQTEDEAGGLAMDHGMATIYFAQEIEEAEAKWIWSEINQLLPEHCTDVFHASV